MSERYRIKLRLYGTDGVAREAEVNGPSIPEGDVKICGIDVEVIGSSAMSTCLSWGVVAHKPPSSPDTENSDKETRHG